jgi:hypothetical protein
MEKFKERDIFKKQINYFPLTSDEEIIGKQIKNINIENGKVTNIPVKVEDKVFNIISNIEYQNKYNKINNKQETIFDEKYKFYFRDNIRTPHLLAIKQMDKQTYIREAYDLNGLLLNSVVDKIESDKLVSRKTNDKNFLEIHENEITYSEENIKLQPIKASQIVKKNKIKGHIENPNIGVIDLETYTISSVNKARVYSAGLYCIHNKKPIIFYIDKSTMDNNKVIYDLFNDMFKTKYKGII